MYKGGRGQYRWLYNTCPVSSKVTSHTPAAHTRCPPSPPDTLTWPPGGATPAQSHCPAPSSALVSPATHPLHTPGAPGPPLTWPPGGAAPAQSRCPARWQSPWCPGGARRRQRPPAHPPPVRRRRGKGEERGKAGGEGEGQGGREEGTGTLQGVWVVGGKGGRGGVVEAAEKEREVCNTTASALRHEARSTASLTPTTKLASHACSLTNCDPCRMASGTPPPPRTHMHTTHP